MSAFQEIFQTLLSTVYNNLDEKEVRFGSTFRRNLEISLSDTTILMVYALTEGFFFEEYDFYFKGNKPENLAKAIDGLFEHLNIQDSELIADAGTVSSLRQARNAISHRNGTLKDTEKQAIRDSFDGRISVSNGYPVAAVDALCDLVNTGNRLISKYSELALNRVANA